MCARAWGIQYYINSHPFQSGSGPAAKVAANSDVGDIADIIVDGDVGDVDRILPAMAH